MNVFWLLVAIYPWQVADRTPGENEAMVMPLRAYETQAYCLTALKSLREMVGPPSTWGEALACVPADRGQQ